MNISQRSRPEVTPLFPPGNLSMNLLYPGPSHVAIQKYQFSQTPYITHLFLPMIILNSPQLKGLTNYALLQKEIQKFKNSKTTIKNILANWGQRAWCIADSVLHTSLSKDTSVWTMVDLRNSLLKTWCRKTQHLSQPLGIDMDFICTPLFFSSLLSYLMTTLIMYYQKT